MIVGGLCLVLFSAVLSSFAIIWMRKHSGESCDFRILKNGGFLSQPLDSGKTFFDISVNTD